MKKNVSSRFRAAKSVNLLRLDSRIDARILFYQRAKEEATDSKLLLNAGIWHFFSKNQVVEKSV